jgi:LacI family transcriptional regulator
MKDIARDLKVSIVTVSKVLRNHSDISPETRARVLKRARELHYQPNWAARSLVTGRSYMIGLIVPSLVHPFFAEVARGISKKIRRSGYSLVITSAEEDPKLEQQEIEHLLARQVDALIIASTQLSFGESQRRIETRNVPYILVDRNFSDLRANYVGADNDEIGALATQHLIECGCHHIAHICGPMISTGTGRLKGYRRALERHGLKVPPGYEVAGSSGDDDAEASGYEAMRKLMALRPRPDGVFCFNDPTAVGAMKAIFDAGLGIPDDFAIVGAGNFGYDSLLCVPLSSIDQSSASLGERAAKLALGLIDSKDRSRPRTIILPPRLVVRESSRKGGSCNAVEPGATSTKDSPSHALSRPLSAP